jgi:hypothetical protein
MNTLAVDARRRKRCARRQLGALALIGVLAAPSCAQDATPALGRLFFSAEQRQMLDRQRRLDVKEAVAAAPTLTIDGVVTRSSGKRTVWINGVAQSGAPGDATVVSPQRDDPGQVVVQASGAKPVKARVGDSVDRHSGEAAGLLGGGSIKIRRSTSAATSR